MQEKSNFFTLQKQKNCIPGYLARETAGHLARTAQDRHQDRPQPWPWLQLAPWPPVLQKLNKYATFAAMDLNENIKILCKARGLTFAELANRLNVTRQTLYRQSTGSAQLSTLERIAAALQVPVFILVHPAPAAALLSWNGRPAPGPAAVLACPYCSRPIYIHAATPAQEAHDRTGDQDENGEGQTDQDEGR